MNPFISLLIYAFALHRMFREYETKYNFLFHMGCRPLDLMVYPNFCSDREILCLKRHFMFVTFCSSYMSLTFDQFVLCFYLLHFKVIFTFSISSYMLCFLLNKLGLFYMHPQELLNRFPNIFQMAFCLKFLGLEP